MRDSGFVVLSLACALVASSAHAQVPGSGGGAPPTPQQSGGGAFGRMTADQEMSRFENEEQRRRHSLTPEEAEAEYGEERMNLARRVAELVEQGQCREARAMANEAGERQMALNVRRTCHPR